MSDHQKQHNGRDVAGNFKVRQLDVEELLQDPNGVDYVRDDVRLGGAIEDTGLNAAEPAKHIGELIEENREDVGKVTGKIPKERAK
jgi:hypothetical protein